MPLKTEVKMKLSLFLLFYSFSIYASPNMDGACSAKLKIFELSKLEMQNCKLAGALVENAPEIKEYQKNQIYEKLSKKLATQLEQNLEDIALIDQFYSSNKQDLTMGSDKLKNSCKVDHIKNIESKCGGKKLELLKKHFPTKGGNLVEQIINKYAHSFWYLMSIEWNLQKSNIPTLWMWVSPWQIEIIEYIINHCYETRKCVIKFCKKNNLFFKF